MDTEHLLNNLAGAFDTSNHKQSQDLIKKIISLAAKKLNRSKNLKDPSSQKQSHSIRFLKTLFNNDVNKPKRKLISKAKLRRTALKKIANKNKMIHEKFIKTTHRKQLTIGRKRIQTRDLTTFQFENEEHKFQSHDEENSENCCANLSRQKSPQHKQESKQQRRRKRVKSCEKMVCEKLKKTRKNFENYLKSSLKESKTDDITCPICIETLIDPVSTICGHSFCFRCLDESLLFGSTCPVCRLQIKGYEIIPCSYLKNLIKMKCVEFLEDEQAIATFRLRREQNEEWKRARFLKASRLKEGDVVDVRDTQNIWCKATIVKIYKLNGEVNSILVHYLQWAKLYDEIIEIKSIRLASKDYFSTRTDIPRYNLASGEENLRGAVITGNNNEGSFRNVNEELTFSNILQLRNRITSLQNSVVRQIVPYNRVSFLHHLIPDSDASQQDISSPLHQNHHDEQSHYDQSSLGSFLFADGDLNSPLQYSASENQDDEGLHENDEGMYEDDEDMGEIGEPYHRSFVSIRGSSQQEDEDNDQEEYWNARREVFSEQEHYENDPISHPYENIQSLRPPFHHNITNLYEHIDLDEYSYGENSYTP